MNTNTIYIVRKPRCHPEGYASDVTINGEDTRLATAYGATPEEAQRRATLIAAAFGRF